MIIIGDSLIKNLKSNCDFTVNSYPGMTLLEYLKIYNDLQEDEDIIVYSLGTNDYDGLNFEEILRYYQLLKKGTISTYFTSIF